MIIRSGKILEGSLMTIDGGISECIVVRANK